MEHEFRCEETVWIQEVALVLPYGMPIIKDMY